MGTRRVFVFAGTVVQKAGWGAGERGEVTPKARAEGVLTRVGLSGYADRDVANLSGGEAQRVSLARALANSPLVLLLDERALGLLESPVCDAPLRRTSAGPRHHNEPESPPHRGSFLTTRLLSGISARLRCALLDSAPLGGCRFALRLRFGRKTLAITRNGGDREPPAAAPIGHCTIPRVERPVDRHRIPSFALADVPARHVVMTPPEEPHGGQSPP